MFLDPFGMNVDWSTIESIAATKAIDLWYLFPLGVALNRLLTRDGNIQPGSRERIDRVLGTSKWYNLFYEVDNQLGLLETGQIRRKNVDFEAMAAFIVDRLDGIFCKVDSRMLYNSRNNPIYLLCFAAGNPKGADTAVKIAGHILRQS